MANKIIRSTRGSRRTFAKKSKTSISELRHQFMMRGGGYL